MLIDSIGAPVAWFVQCTAIQTSIEAGKTVCKILGQTFIDIGLV